MTLIAGILVLFVIFAASRAFLRWRDKQLSSFEFILWLAIWSTIALATSFPQLTDKISTVVGVGRGVDVAFLLAITILFYLLFRLYNKLDWIDKNITELVIRLSIEKKKEKHE